MKKNVCLLIVFIAFISSCTNGPKKSQLITENDSLKNVIAARDAVLDEMINTINVVEEGFKSINEAQGRINLDVNGAEQSKMVTLQNDVRFINETLDKNRLRIAELEKKLNNNQAYSKQLKTMVEKLKSELEEKNKQLIALQEELKNKNIYITELDKTLEALNSDVNELNASKKVNEKIISQQDSELNTVWYAIGTKSELKEMKILDGKKVLQNTDANMSYFTKSDLRELTEIETHEKNAKLLTIHPEGSYKLERNSDRKYVLTIVNPQNFWSVSKYLVIQVR